MSRSNSLVSGSAGKRLITFSMPIILGNLIQAIYGIVDMVVVGQYIGSSGMSAVSIGAQITTVVMVLAHGLSNGGTIITAQLFGKGEHKEIPRLVGTLLSFFVLISLALTVILILLTKPLLMAVNTPDVAFDQAIQYFIVCMIGTLFVYTYNCMAAILRGAGNSTVPMVIVFVTVVLNAILDVLFVAVFSLDVFGAALATISCQFVSMVLIAIYIKKKTTYFDFKFSSFRINKQYLTLVAKIGLPQSVQFFFASTSFVFLSGLVNLYGVEASAAAGAASKIQTLANLPAQGMMTGLIALTAQNLAAGESKRALKGMFTGMIFSGAIGVIVYVLCVIFPNEVFRIFTSEASVAAVGIDYLKVMGVSFVLEGIMFCLFGVIAGAGYTPLTMSCGIISAFIARYSAAWIFSRVLMLGFNGIGLAYNVGPIISSAICIIFLFTGKWKNPRVQVK